MNVASNIEQRLNFWFGLCGRSPGTYTSMDSRLFNGSLGVVQVVCLEADSDLAERVEVLSAVVIEYVKDGKQ